MALPATANASLSTTAVPYMGWNTYYQVGGNFCESTIKSVANSLVTSGLRDAGYKIVWLDFGWASGARDSSGNLLVDTTQPTTYCPNGQWPDDGTTTDAAMSGFTAWLHAHGFEAGIYTDAGTSGCSGQGVGSYGHYQQDANQFAAWGFDAVKMDFCGAGQTWLDQPPNDPRTLYAQFSTALANNSSGRSMILNVCNFWTPGQINGTAPSFADSSWDAYSWAPADAQSWRTDTDIGGTGSIQFVNVVRNLGHDAGTASGASQPGIQGAAGPPGSTPPGQSPVPWGHWNDPDYLGPGLGMTDTQAQSQFSMWAMVAAPLILGSDPRSLSSTSLSMLENPRVIAIDQDSLGVQGYLLSGQGTTAQVWVRPLANGDRAVALFNTDSSSQQVSTTASAVGMPNASRYQLLDAWTNQTTTTNGDITATVPANAVVLYRVSSAPTVTTGSPNSVGTTSATVSGTVNPNGQATTYHFDYGTSTSYGSTAPGSPYPSAGSGTTAQSVSTNLTGLAANTTYHYRLEATNATGTTYGPDQTFTTGSGVTTGSADSVGTTSATVSGTVNPNGQATTYHFDYGTSTSYGSTAPGSPYPSAGSGTTTQSVSTNLTGLAASTTYHYRLEATNATGTTYGSDQTFTTASGVSNAPQGSWVGTYGANGYELAAWSGGSDVVAMPGVSLSVSNASRYLWASNTTNVRALQSADRSTRNAATYYSSSGFKVALRFSSPYSGNLALYAVDLDNLARSETITVGTQTANLSDFSNGAWVTFPISAAANGTVTITVTNTGPGNAVLSGIFLGGGGTPPSPNFSTAPQGSWVGTHGARGYDLAAWSGGSDVVAMPGVSLSVSNASRYLWASNTTNVRALQSADRSTRNAATYYSSSGFKVALRFSSPYSGNLALYAVDLDNLARSETITVGTQTANLSDFSNGAWVTFPISAAANGTVTITVTDTGPGNAVLSGIFLG